jgi:hypothetical protein
MPRVLPQVTLPLLLELGQPPRQSNAPLEGAAGAGLLLLLPNGLVGLL